jgi:hypothetical protein
MFININIAAMCYYQNRYININKKHINPEQKIIDNLDLYYQLNGNVTVNPLSTSNDRTHNRVVISSPETFKYNGLLKFCNKPLHDDHLKDIYLANKEKLFVTTPYVNSQLSDITPNSHVIDFQETDDTTDTFVFWECNIYIKLSDLINFSLINGIDLNCDFYSPILVNSYQFQDYIENICLPDTTASNIIDYRDELIGFTSFITSYTSTYIIAETVSSAVMIWNDNDKRLIDNYNKEKLKDKIAPDLYDLKEMLLTRLNNSPQEVDVEPKTGRDELFTTTLSNSLIENRLFSEITHSSENLELLKKVVIEFWEGKEPNFASKEATNSVIQAYIKDINPEISATLAKNIAMIVRPDKYK